MIHAAGLTVPAGDRNSLGMLLARTALHAHRGAMLYLVLKALISGIIVAAASEVARRWPGIGGLIVSLPLVSLLAFVWLWRDTGDPERVAQLSSGAFWFFLPSMPLFLVLPSLLRSGFAFWVAFMIVIAMTVALYAGMFWLAPKFGLKI